MDIRRLLLLMLALTLGLLAGRPARAQTVSDVLRFAGHLPAASGARLTGMAGAGIGGFAAPGMLFTNPAGLAYFETSQAQGVLAVLSAQDESVYYVPLPDGAGPSMLEESLTDYGGAFSLVYKFPTERGSLVFGGGLHQVNVFGRALAFRGEDPQSSITETFLPLPEEYAVDEQGLFFPGDVPGSLIPFIAYQGGAIEFYRGDFEAGEYPFEPAVLPGTAIVQVGDVLEEGQINEISLAGAVEAARGVMLGLSTNITFGTYHFSYALEEIDQGGNVDYIALRDGQRYVGLDRILFQQGLESELAGFSLRGGLSAEVTPGVRAGLTIETPTFYQISETYTTAAVTTFFLDGSRLAYGDNFEETEGQGSFDYDVQTPWRFGAGVLVDVGALADASVDLRLLADVEFVDWSQAEVDAESFDYAELNRALREDLQATVNTRLGAELGLGDFALRAGFAYQPDPYEQPFVLRGGEEADASKTYLSLGLGYHFSPQFQLDVAWMQQRFTDQYAPYPFSIPANHPYYEQTNTALPVPPVVDEQVQRSFFRVGLSYSF